MRSLAFLVLLTAPAIGRGDEERERPRDEAPRSGCAVEIASGSERVQSGDVVIGRGERAGRVVALGGTVRLERGATADGIVALGGDAIVEEGATVRGDVAAVGGDVRIAKRARVEGSASAVGGQLEVAEGAALLGRRSHLRAEVNGVGVARYLTGIFTAALQSVHCRVEIRTGE